MNRLAQNNRNLVRAMCVAGVVLASLVLAGCSGGSSSITRYEAGFNDGFAQDDYYFTGYDDSWYTIGSGPLLYQGGDIPYIDDFTYDAGYYDGLFYAYNDGYWVAYRYAFIIGFSEGYDNAFAPDYLDFLAFDTHVEYLTGGFSDGYNDGFTEGRVFGAFDYEAFLPFDWLDALRDWENGTDLYFEEVDVGTGVFGPAVLYEWGTDPHFLRSGGAPARGMVEAAKGLRNTATDEGHTAESRPLEPNQTDQLLVTPTESLRSGRTLRIEQSWLERIEAYASGPVARDSGVSGSRGDSGRAHNGSDK
jgi:hypothetical protein